MGLDGLFLGMEKGWKVKRRKIAAKSNATAYRRHEILLWKNQGELQAKAVLEDPAIKQAKGFCTAANEASENALKCSLHTDCLWKLEKI